jgi:malonate transporter and related proteins
LGYPARLLPHSPLMFTVFQVTLPVFGLVFCGWLAARRRMLSDEQVSGINAFVFWFALPAMLFRAVAAHPVAEIADPRFLAAYACAGLLMFFGTRAFARGGGRDRSLGTGYALNATHGNIGYLGLPLLAQLGDPSRVPPLVMAMVVDIFVVILLSIVLFEVERGRRSAGAEGAAAASVASGIRLAVIALVRSPLILGIGAGLVFSTALWTLPPVADSFTALLAAAAGPCALFAIGASLGSRPIVIDRAVSGLIALKLLVHPALVAAAAALLNVDPRTAAIGVLAASLPAASNTYILAQRYGVDTRAISAAIVAGTFAAAITVTAVIWLLGLLA